MIGEVRNETALSTAEIANPGRSQYQDRDTPIDATVTDNEALDNLRDVKGTRALVSEPTVASDEPGPLFPDSELNELRARWDKTQIGFVDEPRAAVEQADSLVATVVKRIAEQFAAERAELEHQWDRGDNVSTEDLRQALRKYRSFFDRLLEF
jgi:hypothetical protein